MKYKVVIEETVSQAFEVEADSIEAATDKAIAGYKSGEYVVESGNVTSKKMLVGPTEWIDF